MRPSRARPMTWTETFERPHSRAVKSSTRQKTAKRPARHPRASTPAAALSIHPLTPDRWTDITALFGPRGACAGCWCMWWRRTSAQFAKGKGEGNRRAFHRIVHRGETPGLIAYLGNKPVGWCAVGPRDVYPRLERSRVLRRVDDRPVWSVTCFFVERSCRRQGISVDLLRAAASFARRRGAKTLEGYPIAARDNDAPDAFVWTGLASAYRRAGFREVARRSPTRPIMRIELG